MLPSMSRSVGAFVSRLSLVAVLAACGVMISSRGVHAAPIALTNPTITASQTPHDGNWVADNVFDQDFTQTTLTGDGGVAYATGNPTGANADAFIDFDFGGPTFITEFHFWDRTINNDINHSFNLILDDNSDFSSPIHTFTFARAFIGGADFELDEPDGDGITTRQEFQFASAANSPIAGVTAQYVRWQSTSSQSIFEGAAEMKFYTTPEPSSIVLALFGIAGVGLAALRRRRR